MDRMTPPLSDHAGNILDFRYEPLVDEDDPGFDPEFDSDFSDLSDGSDSDSENSLENFALLDSPESIKQTSNRGDDQSESSSSSESEPYDDTDAQLRDLTNSFQTLFLEQPKSTQLVLRREVSALFTSYAQHGSAARLSASVMAFLSSGDVAMREKKIEARQELDPKTLKKKPVERRWERVRLGAVPLPVVGFDPNGIGTKRKAEGECEGGGGERKRTALVKRDVGVIGERISAVDAAESGRPRTAGKVFPGRAQPATGVEQPMTPRVSGLCEDFSRMLDHPGPQNQQHPQQSHRHIPTQHTTPSPPKPQPGQQALTCPEHIYTLTTDAETNQLLRGPDPQIPFHPLSDLKVTIPTTSPTDLPTGTVSTLTKILTLHAHLATHHLTALESKYTLPVPPSGHPPPDPPFALFRLALIQKLHSDLDHLFTPTLAHPLAVTPDARAVMRDLYDRLAGGSLNEVEAGLVGRLTGLDGDAVRVWWEERGAGLLAWKTLRLWVLDRETEAVVKAKREGRY